MRTGKTPGGAGRIARALASLEVAGSIWYKLRFA